MDNLLIFFDTETTGIPVWKEPSGGDNQPHIVQLAAALVGPGGEILDTMNRIVRPEGWTIPDDMAEIHGITNERAMDEGIGEHVVLEEFLGFWGDRKRIAFNTTFDNRIIRIATKRFAETATVNRWKGGEYECAMIKARRIMGGKQPTLDEAFEHFVGGKREGAHDALVDVRDTIDLYFAM